MDDQQATRCAEWLARLGAWSGSHPADKRTAIACEAVRGIVSVYDAEWTAAVEWAGGAPDAMDWARALRLYGPVLSDDDVVTRAHAVPAIVAAIVGGDRGRDTVHALWAVIR